MPNTDITSITGIEQGRAKYAYECALAGKNLNSTTKVDTAYKSYTKKIPMLIKTSGLGAAFAFIKSKMKDDEFKKEFAYKTIYIQTSKWFYENRSYLIPELSEETDLVDEIIKLNSSQYRAVAMETLALFNWLRRFAEGLIHGDPDENESID